MLSLSLSTIRGLVSDLTDRTFSASGAYKESQLDAWINSAINQYEVERARVAGGYRERTANVTTTASTTPAVQSFPANEVVSLGSLSPVPMAVKSVWLVQGGARYQLEPLHESDRGSLWSTLTVQTGRPTVYETIELEDGATALHFWPPADSAYTLEVIYYPQPTQLALAGDLWRYEPGTEDAVLCDVAMRILERDDEADTRQYQTFAQRKAEAFRTLRRALGKRRTGVMQMRDTRSTQYATMRWWPR
jgi:hypothetical protein